MNPTTTEVVCTVLFALAVIHTFLVKKFQEIAHHYPHGSAGETLFHYLGEVEAVFGIWALAFVVFLAATSGLHGAVEYLEGLNFTEPLFVFVIMAMAGTRAIIKLAEKSIELFSKALFFFPSKMAFYVTTLILGPLLGSFITEPAAMTVTALILLSKFYSLNMTQKFKYATVGLLFVNVSIGGTLTNFAAPPVLMVAGKYGWSIAHMVTQFGYKAAVAVVFATFITAIFFKSELTGDLPAQKDTGDKNPTWWITLIHIAFLALVVLTAHHSVFFMGLFIFFLGFAAITKEYQDRIQVKESLMVGFFLAGLVTLGSLQKWWLQPVIGGLGDFALYFGATGLTAITDNAALTYLGSLVDLSDTAKYFLVAGSVTGGGLTVIANAPNPAGFGILKDSFGKDGITPGGLFLAALFPTFLAVLAFLFLPSL